TYGVTDSGVSELIRHTYSLLGLLTFFTAGEKEARAWTIRKGWKAPQAAGVIHSDFEKGFIKAEVVSYDDLVRLGSIQAARDAGKYRLEGKDYVFQDGDVALFRFNVYVGRSEPRPFTGPAGHPSVHAIFRHLRE